MSPSNGTGTNLSHAIDNNDAGIATGQVDAVCASCSGLARYDVAELHAIEQLLGSDVAVAAPKAIWGEAFAGGPAMGMAAAASWVSLDEDRRANVAPLVQGRAKDDTKVVVVTAVGYYGSVSAVVIKRA